MTAQWLAKTVTGQRLLGLNFRLHHVGGLQLDKKRHPRNARLWRFFGY
jgi:hypothetical protein